MAILHTKEYFGIVGSDHTNVDKVYHSLEGALSAKTLNSLDSIDKVKGSLGALAYVMDCPSELHRYNLEFCHQHFLHRPIYLFSEHVSIPLLHHALKLQVKDVFTTPIEQKGLEHLVAEVCQTTDIECFDRQRMADHFMPEADEVINHPLEDLFEIIEQHFVDAPSLSDVSSSLFLSPSRISHMFKDLCGIGYCQYILCRRIEESEYLLAQENASITAIAFQVGFSNPSHFCRSFKEHIGLTPTAYIKNQVGIELSCLYKRYQTLRMELLPIAQMESFKQRRSANY